MDFYKHHEAWITLVCCEKIIKCLIFNLATITYYLHPFFFIFSSFALNVL